RTTTAPLACFASFPVSKEIVLSPTSAVTWVTLNLLIRIFTSGRPDDGHSFLTELSFLFPLNGTTPGLQPKIRPADVRIRVDAWGERDWRRWRRSLPRRWSSWAVRRPRAGRRRRSK